MAKKTFRTAVLFKNEASYSVDPTPVATDAVLLRNAEITPLDAETEDRVLVRTYYGAYDKIIIGKRVKIDVEVEIAGAGSLGTVPAWGPLLRACAWSQTINATVSVVYGPVSTSQESGYAYFNVDGILHKVGGLRGSVSLDLNARKIPVYKFSFVGLYVAPSDTALPSQTLTGWVKPVAVNNANTTGFSLHGYAAILHSLSINVDTKPTYKNLVGTERVDNEDHMITGSAQIELPTIAAKDYFASINAETKGALAIDHGPVTNRVTLAASNVQLLNPTYSDADGDRHLKMDLIFTPSSAGNDALTITAR